MAINWSKITSGFDPTYVDSTRRMCIYNNKLFVGTQGVTSNNKLDIYESADGISFVLNNQFTLSGVIAGNRSAINGMCVFDDGVNGSCLYIIIGTHTGGGFQNPRIWRYNGVSWTEISGSNSLGGALGSPYHTSTGPGKILSYNNELYVIASGGGASPLKGICWSSPNGIGTFTREFTTTSTHFGNDACVSGGDLFVLASHVTAGQAALVFKKSGGVWDTGTQLPSGFQYAGNIVEFKGDLYATTFSLSPATVPSKVRIHKYSSGSWSYVGEYITATNKPDLFVSADNLLHIQADDNGFDMRHRISSDGSDFSTIEIYGNRSTPTPDDKYTQFGAAINFQNKTYFGTLGSSIYHSDVLLMSDFLGSPTLGFIPLSVSFTDITIGNPATWDWDFGDLSPHSSSQNPVHNYTSPGIYAVSLTVTSGPDTSDTKTQTNYITVGTPIPVADFVGSPTSGFTPLLVSFTDLSTNSPTSWLWDFGDPGSGPLNTSTLQNPTHTYNVSGNYTVTLTATNAGGSDIKVKTNYLHVGVSVADFVGDVTSGNAPLTVNFTDLSTNFPTSWLWDFGDGGLSSDQNPIHIYATPGVYTVTLIATHPITGAKTETKSAYITANIPLPTAVFSAAPIVGYEPLSVIFTNLSTGFPDSYLWDFGDGSSSSDSNPTHIYTSTGTFTVTLTAMNSTGTDTATQNVNVLVVPEVVADFLVSSISPGGGGLVANFLDQSIGASIYSWNFGDPGSGLLNSSTLQNPTHVYPGPGVYSVTLQVSQGPYTGFIGKSVVVTTEPTRYMEIWGTARFNDGTPVSASKVAVLNRIIGATELDYAESATDTFHSYKTVDDAGVTRFLVRARGNVLSIPDSGFEDGDPVYVYIGGRQATTGVGLVPVSIPFYMTLPSNPASAIEIDIVFPVAYTSISPAPGTYNDHISVSLISNVVPSTIYYTIDGSDPKVSPTRHTYIGPFVVSEGITSVRYYTDDPLGSVEPVREAIYIVLPPLVNADPPSADYSENFQINLMGNRAGTIYYRLNHLGSYQQYISPIPIMAGSSGVQTTIVQAYLVDSYAEIGPVQEFVYKIDLINPVITSFRLSNGDPITASPIITVQVAASSHSNSVIGLLLSTFSDFRDASVRLYQPEVTFLLPGPDGIKTVYAKVVDQFDNYSVGLGPNGTHIATIQLSTEIPALTVSPGPSDPIEETHYTFTGTKSPNSGVYMALNGGAEILIIPFSTESIWEYEVVLSVGINTVAFQVGTWVGNRSTTETRMIDSRPIPMGTIHATTITKIDGTWRIPFVFLDEKTGEEATEEVSLPRRQHENIKRRQHDFRIRVTSSFGPDPIVTFPEEGVVLTQNLITVTGHAAPGSIITLTVEKRGKVLA